jgi:pimeloyl-ACP methyl ester carboxylesterase
MVRVHHRETGAGPPLVLIHGFCETGEIWRRFANKLANKFQVIVPDLPGFGKSPLPSRAFTIDEIGSLMLDWMGRWMPDQPVVIGHSLGGYVTLAMVGQRLAGFKGFGLFHSTSYADSPEKKENRNKVMDFVVQHGVEPYIDTFVPGLFYTRDKPALDYVHRIAAQTSVETLLGYAMAMRDRPSYEKILEHFLNPVLFIAGERDIIVPIDQVTAQSQRAHFPVFRALANVGHMGMLEKEDETVKIIEEFAEFTRHFQPSN